MHFCDKCTTHIRYSLELIWKGSRLQGGTGACCPTAVELLQIFLSVCGSSFCWVRLSFLGASKSWCWSLAQGFPWSWITRRLGICFKTEGISCRALFWSRMVWSTISLGLATSSSPSILLLLTGTSLPSALSILIKTTCFFFTPSLEKEKDQLKHIVLVSWSTFCCHIACPPICF